MKRLTTLTAAISIAILSIVLPSNTYAAPITPQMTSFGTLSGATFNGTPISSGIPNTDVAITTALGITLGLTDHGRFANPNPTNDSAGNFFANVGNDSAQGQPNYTQDNVGWHADVPSGTLAMYFDSDTLQTDTANWQLVFMVQVLAGIYSNSWNVGMGFFPEVTNPNFANMTSVRLDFTPTGSRTTSTVSINTFRGVRPVPEPALLSMFGIGAIFLARKIKRQRVTSTS